MLHVAFCGQIDRSVLSLGQPEFAFQNSKNADTPQKFVISPMFEPTCTMFHMELLFHISVSCRTKVKLTNLLETFTSISFNRKTFLFKKVYGVYKSKDNVVKKRTSIEVHYKCSKRNYCNTLLRPKSKKGQESASPCKKKCI